MKAKALNSESLFLMESFARKEFEYVAFSSIRYMVVDSETNLTYPIVPEGAPNGWVRGVTLCQEK